MSYKSTFKLILRGLGLIALFVFVLELGARLDDWIKLDVPLGAAYSHDDLHIADSLGPHNRPNAQFEKWRINSHGFRGPEISMEKGDKTRVVVVGASEAFGLYESPGMEFVAQMQTMLDTKSPGDYQVINAAAAAGEFGDAAWKLVPSSAAMVAARLVVPRLEALDELAASVRPLTDDPAAWREADRRNRGRRQAAVRLAALECAPDRFATAALRVHGDEPARVEIGADALALVHLEAREILLGLFEGARVCDGLLGLGREERANDAAAFRSHARR